MHQHSCSQVKLSEFSVTQHGSLMLENVQKDNSGEYKGIVYNAEGTLIKETVQQFCVLEPVPDPTVLVECIEKGVNLTCSAVNNNAVVVSWMKNGMKANATHAVLHVSSSELKSGDNFSCTVSNMISHKSAKEVEPVCSDTGLDIWWMLVILTGGGSFLLILFIICLVCVCCCSRRNKRKAKEEEEYRLTSLMPDHTNQPEEQYMQQTTLQRPSKSQRPLPPLPSPQGPPCVAPP
ncbi:carcinoembryonic antigen-related cell adhesion molecule 2-like [Sinocyclocheilus rhinocerous]|uniref:carcinoembryonic antigen-related cell adhesion molecule 2-like n=1 Tax=Sinocyclocheilus rhinocerous TaxID=307959 RepID=UPI0007B8E704|nr:PREDICTED: carcinoembryonic antigen-related cell adhesion molecule 2-like [Sinocyclocheilus rhinocerous]